MPEYLLPVLGFVATLLGVLGPSRDDTKPFPAKITAVGRTALVVSFTVAGLFVRQNWVLESEKEAKLGEAQALIETASNSYRTTINKQLSYLTNETPTAALEKLELGISEARKRFREVALATAPILPKSQSSPLVELLSKDESCWYFGDRRWFFSEQYDSDEWVSDPDKLFFRMTLMCSCPLSYQIGLFEQRLGNPGDIGETEICRTFRSKIGFDATWRYSK